MRAREAWPKGGTDVRTHGYTDRRTKCPVFYRTSSLWSAAQKEGKEYKPPVLTEEEKQAEKEKYEQEEKEFNDNAIAQYPADFYPYKHVNPEIRAKSIQFLKIRLGVIVAYLSKIELEKFDTPIVKNFLSYKIEMYKELKELANEL